MSSTGLDVFDKTLQTTHIWLDELMQAIGPDRQVAWHVLGTVLRAIRDRIPLGLAVHLGSQLPILIRASYYEQWRAPGHTLENPPRSLEEFLAPVAEQLANIRPVNVRDATRAVFAILSRHVNRGQIEKVRDAMPEQVRALWADSPEAPDVRARAQRYRGEAARESEDANSRRPRMVKKAAKKTARASSTRKALPKISRTASKGVARAGIRKQERAGPRKQTRAGTRKQTRPGSARKAPAKRKR